MQNYLPEVESTSRDLFEKVGGVDHYCSLLLIEQKVFDLVGIVERVGLTRIVDLEVGVADVVIV